MMEKLNSLNEIFQAVEKCTECKLYKFRNKTVFAEGTSSAKIMVIGLSPGQQENKTGKLFIGPAGDFLNELLSLAKIKRDFIYITNIVKCHAPTYAIGQQEISTCAPYLDKQINIIKPEIIIPLGSAASVYILKKYKLGEGKISKVHGQLFEVAIGDLFTPSQNIKIIPMFHPAAALHNPAFLSSIKEDWQKLSGIVHI
ncbi:MAG: uracil-DNA glycosylase [Candidatus Omnitrophota bacterium]